MPQVLGQLTNGKPIIKVAISDANPMASELTPQQAATSFHVRQYTALLDTGADITCVTPHVVKECILVSRGLVRMTNGVGSFDHMSYVINIGVLCEDQAYVNDEPEITTTLYQIPGPNVAVEIKENSWFDLIIGMDIIAQHELSFRRNGFRLFLT